MLFVYDIYGQDYECVACLLSVVSQQNRINAHGLSHGISGPVKCFYIDYLYPVIFTGVQNPEESLVVIFTKQLVFFVSNSRFFCFSLYKESQGIIG